MLKKLIRTIALRIAGPLPAEEVRWVVNNLGELGVRVGDTSYYLYKGESIIYTQPNDDGTTMMERSVLKREFGEVCRPHGWADELGYGSYTTNYDSSDWRQITGGDPVWYAPIGRVTGEMPDELAA
ncbi:hypothetical protein KC887_01810 [Candidatus Kaiserbacteria bacterium]|nr:hypothetical protein [Candidatus Kaiserbacteria bacterium]